VNLLGQIRKSLGLMQATLLLVSSLVIGLGLSAWEMRSALSEQRQTAVEQATELLNLAGGSAARAAWALDPMLAQDIVSGIINQSGVRAIEIISNLKGGSEKSLVRLDNPVTESNGFVTWTAKVYFSDISIQSRRLIVENQGKQEQVGTLLVELSPEFNAARFLSRVYLTLTVSLLEAFLMGFVLLCVAHWLVTSPLRKAASRIAQIKPETLDDASYSLTIPDRHKNDELGQLLDHTNQLLDRLVDSRKELRRLATRDPLTDLPNRTLIKERLSTLLAAADRASRQVAVIFIDLDRFKVVNDSLGHDIGDRLLQLVALTLVEQVREEDAVGRLGGDEFLVVLPFNDLKHVIAVVRRIIDSLDSPYKIKGHNLRASASIGIAVYPDDGSSAEMLMRRSDLAMYKAKSDPRVRWHMFSEEMSHRLDVGMALESALSGAISRNEMQVFLQPQFYTEGLKLAGCEALLRWNYENQWIQPVEFIEIAEVSGLIFDIGDWVIAEACQILRRWSGREIPISINVSGWQLADVDFVPRVLDIVNRYGIDPKYLVFEITETILMQNLAESFERLNLLREEGFKISIDDFGTGYSSLSYLTRLPIDELKIDRSFVSGSQHSSIVLGTIVAMGRALNIHVVAEGVETEAQRKELADCGCDFLQGYLLGKPMPVSDFESQFDFSTKDNVYRIKTR
jgi:diguanylate cyclase (GGDEF)-like protein